MTRVDIRLSGLLFRLAGLRSVAQSCRTTRFSQEERGVCLVNRQQPRIDARTVSYTRERGFSGLHKGFYFCLPNARCLPHSSITGRMNR
jgi:hypothetical protein